MRYKFTAQDKIFAETIMSLIIGFMSPDGGVIFTFVMMGIHLRNARLNRTHK
jgi:hypothetical protein